MDLQSTGKRKGEIIRKHRNSAKNYLGIVLSIWIKITTLIFVTPAFPLSPLLISYVVISVNHFAMVISACWQKTRVLCSELWRLQNLPAKVSLAACSAQLPHRLRESNYVSIEQVNKRNGVYTARSEWPVTWVETYAGHAIFSFLGKERFCDDG